MPTHWRATMGRTLASAPVLSARARRKVDASPYLVGAGIGVLSWAAFGLAKEPLGVTTALSRTAEPIASLLLGAETVAQNPYWSPMPFAWDYGVLFLAGLMAGAFASALATGTFRVEAVPDFWRARFGSSVARQFVAAFFSGAVMMFGARMAGGCTSGHGISGTLQLALSSWIFLVVLFACALIGSRLVFGAGGGK